MTAHGHPDRVSLDALLAHRDWVRALAHRLVLDPNDAADVEQETWRMAVERPPRHAESLRGWLAAVVRNAARGAGRRQSRRARHEAAAPVRREVPSPEDLVAAAELQTRLARAVLELDEPYRSTVLYRFHEGLESSEIAARLGVPVETVRTRLKRAIERLRERMGVEIGDDRDGWCLLLIGARESVGTVSDPFPTLSSTTTAAAAAGGIAMAVGVKAIAAAAVIAAGVAWWMWPRDATSPGEAITPAATSADVATTAKGVAAGVPERRTGTPDPVAADPGVSSSASPLVVETRTLRDEPVAGASIELRRTAWGEDASRKPADARGSTDAAGRAVFRGLAAGTWSVVARTDSSAEASRNALVFDPGPEQRVTLYLEPGLELRGTVRDSHGEPVAKAVVVGRDRRAVSDASGAFVLTGLPSGEIELRAGRAGEFARPSGVVAVPDVATFDVVLVDYDTVTVTGTVVDDATNAPVEGVVVGNSVRLAESPPPCVTDADGRFRLPGVLRDKLAVMTVKKAGYRTFPAPRPAAVPPPGDVVDVGVLRMQHGATVEGVVSSPNGPVEGAEVVLRSPSRLTGSSQTRARTDAQGRFAFASVEAGSSYLHASAPGFIAQSPGSYGRTLDVPETGVVHAELALARGGVATGRVVDADGNAVPGVFVLGGVQCRTDGEGAFRVVGLVPGKTVRIWTMAEGFASAEQFVDVGAAPVSGVLLRVARSPSVRGRVIARDGRPIEGARVVVVAAQPRGRRDPSRLAADEGAVGPFPVRDDGSFDGQVPYSASEAFSVVVCSASHSPARLDPVALVKGQKEYVVEVALTAGVTVRGRVIADGRGAAGAVITFGQAGHGYTVPPARAVTDASGAFAIERVPPFGPEKMLVTASLAGFVDADADAVEGAALELVLERPLEIAGVVETCGRMPVPGVYVGANPVDAATATSRTIPRKSFAFTDAEGRFRIQGLRPGRYQLVATRTRGPSPIGEAVAAGTTGLRLVVE